MLGETKKPVLKKGMGFYFLWFCPKRSDHQAGYQGGGHESRTRFFALRLTIKIFTLCALRYFEVIMPAIASLEDLKSAQKDLLEAKDLNELKAVFKKWRRIGWKNVCKLWLEERTPEQLKGEGG
jgi:hypothetical protein